MTWLSDDPRFDSIWVKRFFFLCEMYRWAVGPCSLLYSGYWGYSTWCMNLPFMSIPWLTVSAAVPLTPPAVHKDLYPCWLGTAFWIWQFLVTALLGTQQTRNFFISCSHEGKNRTHFWNAILLRRSHDCGQNPREQSPEIVPCLCKITFKLNYGPHLEGPHFDSCLGRYSDQDIMWFCFVYYNECQDRSFMYAVTVFIWCTVILAGGALS